MTTSCPNCRGKTHRYDRHLVCSASCGWSQVETPPAASRVEPRMCDDGKRIAVDPDAAASGPGEGEK